MDRLVYTALSGMRQAEFAQAITANNLANASTIGFQRDAGAFQNRWLEAGGEEGDTRVQASEQITTTEVASGTVTTTGRPLDIALHGDALIAVAAPGGGEAYTRRGDLQIGPDGALTTGDGRAVVGGSGAPITVPPADRVEIAADGQVLVHAAGDATPAMQAVDRIKLVAFAPAAMRKGEDGALRQVDGAPVAADDTARLSSGALEASNVSPVASLVQLIEQSRSFELQTKMVTVAKDLDQSSMTLMSIEG